MLTTIEITGLRVYAHHGVYLQERRVGNEFEVTVHLHFPFGDSDALEWTVNYADVIAIIKDVMAVPTDLIETLCHNIRQALLDRYPSLTGGYIRVAKLQPPVAAELASVAATLTWP